MNSSGTHCLSHGAGGNLWPWNQVPYLCDNTIYFWRGAGLPIDNYITWRKSPYKKWQLQSGHCCNPHINLLTWFVIIKSDATSHRESNNRCCFNTENKFGANWIWRRGHRFLSVQTTLWNRLSTMPPSSVVDYIDLSSISCRWVYFFH